MTAALGELARRATVLIEARTKEMNTDFVADHEAAHEAYIDRCYAEDAFREAATPDVVLQLVALATGGAEQEQKQEQSGKTGNGQLESSATRDADVRPRRARRPRPCSECGGTSDHHVMCPLYDDAALTPERPADA